ncbi:phage adaptor protein [Paenibacillus chitinolyticus]
MGLTAAQIIEKADEKYPNARPEVDKLYDINNLNKRLHRKFKIPTAQTYEVLAQQADYPTGIDVEKFISVVVGGQEYTAKKLLSSAVGASRYYVNLNGFTILHPPPDKDGTMIVYSYSTPPDLTGLDDTPTLHEDYHMIFVYYLCIQGAESMKEYDAASGFMVQFNDIEKEIMTEFQDPEIITIMNESGW